MEMPDWLRELWGGNSYFESKHGPMLIWKDGKIWLHIEDECDDFNWFCRSYPINLSLIKEQVIAFMEILE